MDWNPRPLDAHSVPVHRRGKGAPLVLMHCLGQSHRFWDVLEPLTDQYELITYSYPGHGDAPLPDHQYGVPELTAQLRGIAEREGLHKFNLGGISLGGSVAAHFAGTYPHMVDRLILADCTPRYDEEARANWPVRGRLARENGVASLVPMLLQVFFTAPSIAENGPNVQHVRQVFEACSGEGYGLACEALAHVDAWPQVAKIIAPTLVMLGSNERQSFQDAADRMVATIPGARKVFVPEAGHASIRERPEFAVKTIREFLAG